MTDQQQIAGLRDFADALAKAPAAALEAASIALNAGAELAERKGRDTIVGRVNLEAPYVHKYLRLDKESTRTDLLARVRANKRSVLAPRYGAEVAATSASSRSDRLKGDPLRKIPAGSKSAGSTAWSVLRSGQKKAWPRAFFARLKTSNAWAMVTREGEWVEGMDSETDWEKNLRVVYSMSVDQAWKGVRDEVAPEAMELAEQVFLKEFGNRL
tara:strand:- start:2766 stop:3404 length:639 start_codon:yes stop_codon:yes gene_type:complete